MNQLASFTLGTRLACIVATSFVIGAAPAKPISQHGYNTGHFALEIDGVVVGWVTGVEGGNLTSDVVSEKLGDDNLLKKTTGKTKYQEISLKCGTGMSRQLYDWIKADCAGSHVRHSGAIISCDLLYKPTQRLEFTNGVLSELSFPTLDSASKDAAHMTVHISPERAVFKELKGQAALKSPMGPLKKWLPSNFRVTLPGTDCTKVNKVESIVIRQKVVESSTGEVKGFEKGASVVEPDLVITLAESSAADFYTWRQTTVVKGNGAQGDKIGRVEFLDSSLQNVLFTLNFYHLGIFKIAAEKTGVGADAIKRAKAEMYCERIDFDFSSGAVASRRAKARPGS